MNRSEMIQSLRAEIAKLQRVLDLLVDQPSTAEQARRPGRPKGSGNRATSFNPEEFAPKKRTLSAEGKARIAAAQKKRWAAQKDAAPDRATEKKAASTKRTAARVPRKPASKLAPATAKKGAAAAKRTASPQSGAKRASAKFATNVAAKKSAARKGIAKKTSPAAAKRPVKQAAAVGPGSEATA